MTTGFAGHALAAGINAGTARLLGALSRPARLALIAGEGPSAAAYGARIATFARNLGIVVADRSADDTRSPDAMADFDAILALHPRPAGSGPPRVDADRDAEATHPLHAGRLLASIGLPTEEALLPPTAQAALLCATAMAGHLEGRTVAVVGASPRVGLPLALLLVRAGATVSIGHVGTRDLAALTERCEITISATGVPGLIRREHVADGAILVDVGIVRTQEGLVGDVDLASVRGRAAIVSDVPDGVGPITTACLMRNVALLAGWKTAGRVAPTR